MVSIASVVSFWTAPDILASAQMIDAITSSPSDACCVVNRRTSVDAIPGATSRCVWVLVPLAKLMQMFAMLSMIWGVSCRAEQFCDSIYEAAGGMDQLDGICCWRYAFFCAHAIKKDAQFVGLQALQTLIRTHQSVSVSAKVKADTP